MYSAGFNSLDLPVTGGVFSIQGDAPQPAGHIAINCILPYAMKVAVGVQMPYGVRPVVGASVSLPYGDLNLLRIAHEAPYNLLESVAFSFSQGYSLLTYDPVAVTSVARYSLSEDSIQSVASFPRMIVNDEPVDIVGASISCDEGSPYWIAQVTLANLEDYAKLNTRDPFYLEIGSASFAFVVDGKTFNESMTDDGLEITPRITGTSPLSLMDAPVAMGISVGYTEPTSARKVVEDQIGVVDWELPDWIIQVGALVFTNSTPLAIAKKVVEAIGGLIESRADGTPVCRKRFPVSVPDYALVTPDYVALDSMVFVVSETISPSTCLNRVTVSNDLSRTYSSTQDTMDFVEAEGDPTTRTIRVYLTTQRPVRLVHTGDPSTSIQSLGLRRREEKQRVEFIDGKAKVSYPISAITGKVWRSVDLGVVSFSGYDLTSEVPEYSLLDITYAVDSVDFLVTCPRITEVQFYLVDA